MKNKSAFGINLYVKLSIVFLFLNIMLPVNAKSFLWELDFKGVKSYLLGSVHMMKKDIFPLNKEIEQAFEKCKILVVEADISPDKTADILKATFENAKFTDGSVLKDHISEKTYELLKKKMDKLGMSVDFFKTFKPWFVAMTITSMELVKLGFNPDFGIDRYFMVRAKKKKIVELEGIRYQMNLFNNFSDKENESFLISSINETSSFGKNINDMVKAWKVGDSKKMLELVDSESGKYPEMERLFSIIIGKRNREMADKIDKMIIKGESYFIVVGAAHLIGDKGIIHLLEKKGFLLRQI